MRRTTLLTILMTTVLAALPASAGHDDKGLRWDRYQHYDFRTRGGHGYREHSYHYRPHYVHHDHYYVYRSDHHGHGHRHHHHDHHDHDLYAIIGGAILLHEILD